MNRREFLGLLGKGVVVVGAGGLIVPAAKKIWQVPVQLKPLGFYKPKQFEDILQSAIQIVRDNYGQPTDCYVSKQTYESLEASLAKIDFDSENIHNWKGWGSCPPTREPIREDLRRFFIQENNTYSLMKRIHRDLYSGNSKA